MIASLITGSTWIICGCTFWAFMSLKVRDGIIGKTLLGFMCASTFAISTRGNGPHIFNIENVSEATFIVCTAAMWIRYFVVKYLRTHHFDWLAKWNFDVDGRKK